MFSRAWVGFGLGTLLWCLVGCDSADKGSTSPSDAGSLRPDSGMSVPIRTEGQVLDAESGKPVASATLTTPSVSSVKSDARGAFELVSDRVEAEVLVTRASFAPTYRPLPSAGGSLDVYLKGVDKAVRFRGDKGITVKLPSGLTLEIPKNAVLDNDGKRVSGEVSLELAVVDGRTPTQAAALPGNSEAQQKGKSKGRISIEHGLSIRVLDSKNGDLDVDKNADVVVEIPPRDGAEPVLGVYAYNAKDRRWNEESQVTLGMNAAKRWVYRVDIDHLSWWSLGRFFDVLTCVRACVKDTDGQAVPGAQVWMVGKSIPGVSAFFAGESGCGAGDAIADEDVVLVAQADRRVSNSKAVSVGHRRASVSEDAEACQNAKILTLGGASASDCSLCSLTPDVPPDAGMSDASMDGTVPDAAMMPDASDPSDGGFGALAERAYLKASNIDANDFFGYAVGMSGDTLVVGAYHERSNAQGIDGDQGDNSASDSGAVYVFVRNGKTWVQEAYLKASNSQQGDAFGYSVAISGDTIVVGAPGEDSAIAKVNGYELDDNAANAGAAYVFVRSGMTWAQEAYLKPSNTEESDAFGRAVGIYQNTIVVGAPLEDGVDNAALDSGAAYVFFRNGTGWAESQYLKASNTEAGDEFGSAVAVDVSTVAVSAPKEDSSDTGPGATEDDNDAPDSGAVYVFIEFDGDWSQQAYLKASNTGSNDLFGEAVAISMDTLVVGASDEDSAATAIDGDGDNDDAQSCGAAYVFTRSVDTWTQSAYLKASNGRANHDFGASVGIDGDLIVVGAFQDDSPANTVNGIQTNAATSTSVGAAFLFERSGATFIQTAYLKASNSGEGDWFGQAVSVSGAAIAVGAYREDSANGMRSNNGAAESGAVYVFR